MILRNKFLALVSCILFAWAACSDSSTERDNPRSGTPDASLGGSGGSGGAGGSTAGGAGGLGGIGGTTDASFEMPVAPAAPTALVAQVVDETSIELSWVDNSGGSATFEIRWSTENVIAGPANATVAAGVTTFIVTGLTTNQPYYFWVRAVAQGIYSADATTTKMPVTVPLKPTAFRAAPGPGGTVDLSWSPVLGADGYRVYWAIYQGGDAGIPTKPATPNVPDLAAETTTYHVTGLEPCTTYFFWVAAFNAIDAGAAAQTSAKPEVVPADPTDLAVQVVGTSATVNWKDNATNEANYIVSWASGTGATKPVTGMSVAASDAGATMSYVINGLTPGLAYTVWVEAKNCIGSSSAVSGAANTVDLPPAPTDFSATVSGPASDVLHLAWVNVAVAGDGGSTTDAKGIRIYYSATDTIPTTPQVDNLPVTATSADITGLTPLVTYHFWIVAFNDSGESNPALTGTGAVGGKPTTPTGLTVDTATSKFRITVLWNPATAGDGGAAATQSWKLDWTINGLPANTAPIVLPAATTSYAVTDVIVNSSYVFTLKATNVIGDSAPATSAPASSFAIPGHSGSAIRDAYIEPNGQLHFGWFVGNAGDAVGATAYTAYYALTNVRPAAGFNTQAPDAAKTYYWWAAGGFLATSPRYFWGGAAGPDGNLIWPTTMLPGPDLTGALAFSGQNDTSMTVSWPAVAGAQGYRVRWSETATMPTNNADSTNSAFVAALTPPATQTYTINGLLSGTDYHVWVESTGAAIENTAASPNGLPGAVRLSAVGTSGGAKYTLISTTGMTATHNTAFVSNCPTGVFADMNAWDADTGSLWGYDNAPAGCVPFTVNGGIIQEWTTGTPWVQLDLGAPHAIARVRVNWQGQAGALRYQVQGSANGTNWTNIVDACNTTDTCATPLAYSSDVWIAFNAPGGPTFPQYRYVRLILPSNKAADYKTTNYGVKVRSLELYEP